MAKTKTTSNQMPRGFSELKSDTQIRPNLDYTNLEFAEKHYGKYFIVQNENNDKAPSHNRFYLCYNSKIEFMNTYAKAAMLKCHMNRAPSHTELLSLYPDQKIFILNTLNIFLVDVPKRDYAEKIVNGFSLMLDIFKHQKIKIKSIEELNNNHIKVIQTYVDKGSFSRNRLMCITAFLNLCVLHFSLKLNMKNLTKYAKNSISISKELSLAVTWQLDIYAQKELDVLIERAKEYRTWMNELDKIGNLFKLENLAHTFFENSDKLGRKSGTINRPIRRLAKALYGVELLCWTIRDKGISSYLCDNDKEREKELRKIAKLGINITINDERMFAMWHKVVAPNYPFEREFLPKYKEVVRETLERWRNYTAIQCKFLLSEFDKRIYPGPGEIYPLYLLALCRSGLNQDPVKDWRVWQDESSSYHIGVDSGMGRIVDGKKGRGNTIQSTALDRNIRRYMDFFVDFLTPIYNHSGDDHFFQYLVMKKKQNSKIFQRIHTKTLAGQRLRKDKNMFYRKYTITDTDVLPSSQHIEKRLFWIDHTKIRKIKNLSEYLEGKQQWERQYLRGQKKLETENIYQQTVQFKDIKRHRIAKSQDTFVKFLTGKISVEDNPHLKIFNGPIADCKDPFNPTYLGAKKLHNNDVCTNWRKCLTECDQCDVIAPIHGPVIVAWRNCMDELRSTYKQIEIWEKEFLWDYMAAEATLSTFPKNVLKECEIKAPSYSEFIKREVLNSKKIRKLTEEEHDVR